MNDENYHLPPGVFRNKPVGCESEEVSWLEMIGFDRLAPGESPYAVERKGWRIKMEAESKLPYSCGSKPEPKLEWKVEQSPYRADIFYIQFLVDGEPTTDRIRIDGTFRLKSRIRRAKKRLLELYHLCQRESGRVE